MIATFSASTNSSRIDLRNAKKAPRLDFPSGWGGGATCTLQAKANGTWQDLMKDDNTAYTINCGASESVVMDDTLFAALGGQVIRLVAASSTTDNVPVVF